MKLYTVTAYIYFWIKVSWSVKKQRNMKKLISKMSMGTQLSLKSGILWLFPFHIVYIVQLFKESAGLLPMAGRPWSQFHSRRKMKAKQNKKREKKKGQGEKPWNVFQQTVFEKDHCGDDARDEDGISTITAWTRITKKEGAM